MSSNHSKTTVNKIGGVNMTQMDVVAHLIDKLESREENIILVVSAFEGVTQKLIDAMDALNEKDYTEKDIEEAFKPVKTVHETIIAKFFQEKNAEAKTVFKKGFDLLAKRLMTHKAVSNTLMPVEESFGIRDQVIGFGENMSAALLELYLQQKGKKTRFIQEIEADREILNHGPVTDRTLHEAKKSGIARALNKTAETQEQCIRIISGHVAGTPKGEVVHQGRGYSDITAVDTSLAVGEGVTATRFWKDVDGIYTANPKDLQNGQHRPVLHDDISNIEALENASAGSEIINVNALSLARKYGLDLQIRNIKGLNPDHGTNITTGAVNTDYVFKTIVSNPDIDAITIKLPEMADKGGFMAAIAKVFSEQDLNINHTGEEGTSITFGLPLPRDEADKKTYRTRIRKAMRELKIIEVKGERFTVETPEWDKGRFASISIIGSELQNRVGILGSISTTFGCFGINVYTVSHSKQQTRISFLIDSKDRKKAVQLLHNIYVDNDGEVKKERNRRAMILEDTITGTFKIN